MAVSYMVADWIVWSVIVFCFFLLLGMLAVIWFWMRERRSDVVILFDEIMRWRMVRVWRINSDFLEIEGADYHADAEASLLSSGGKKLYIFHRNKANPLRITKNDTEWVSSENIRAALNNEFIKMMIIPANKLLDIIMMIGAGTSMLGCIVGIVILSKVMGWMK